MRSAARGWFAIVVGEYKDDPIGGVEDDSCPGVCVGAEMEEGPFPRLEIVFCSAVE